VELSSVLEIFISNFVLIVSTNHSLAVPELILTDAGEKFTYINGGWIADNRDDVNQWETVVATNGICHDAICRTAQTIFEQFS
jgi:3'(2'), 5'-bisphosphate nucleotidase